MLKTAEEVCSAVRQQVEFTEGVSLSAEFYRRVISATFAHADCSQSHLMFRQAEMCVMEIPKINFAKPKEPLNGGRDSSEEVTMTISSQSCCGCNAQWQVVADANRSITFLALGNRFHLEVLIVCRNSVDDSCISIVSVFVQRVCCHKAE